MEPSQFKMFKPKFDKIKTNEDLNFLLVDK